MLTIGLRATKRLGIREMKIDRFAVIDKDDRIMELPNWVIITLSIILALVAAGIVVVVGMLVLDATEYVRVGDNIGAYVAWPLLTGFIVFMCSYTGLMDKFGK